MSFMAEEALEKCILQAQREVQSARKRARKHPRYRSGAQYWEGMLQAYKNALTLLRAPAPTVRTVA